MPSTTLQPVATAIANVISGLSVTYPVKGYADDPGFAGLDFRPAGTVGIPSINRKGPDEKESQLGSTDWDESWPVTFIFDLDESQPTIRLVREVIEAFIKAVDADNTLAGTVFDGKVVRVEDPLVAQNGNKELFVCDCRVGILQLVPQP